jgi:hypothetical protein
MQQDFLKKAVECWSADPGVLGIAVAGSWIDQQIDKYSDLDFVVVTSKNISGNVDAMRSFATRPGHLLNAFTGEHVGEPRLLICLYSDPLLHVDIKFLTLTELDHRVEDPVIIYEKDQLMSDQMGRTKAAWPSTSSQWIEDRFWTWIHYLATKIGRGELFEAIDGLSFLRSRVLASLLQKKYGRKERGVRKLEMDLSSTDLKNLEATIPSYSRSSVIQATEKTIALYLELSPGTGINEEYRTKTLEYFREMSREFV